MQTMLDNSMFNIGSSMKELDLYKMKYESLGQEVTETFQNNKKYMEETSKKLIYHMN